MLTPIIENTFSLSIHNIKKDLRLAREHKPSINGFINIEYENKKLIADYYFEYDAEYDYLVIQYGENEQKIKLAETELYFGTTSLFLCDCGRHANKLYLPYGATDFKCRRCHSLVYSSQKFNKNTKSGKVLYQANQLIKLINKRENMRSIFYDGKYTKRFNNFLYTSEILGMREYAEDAKRLLSFVNGN